MSSLQTQLTPKTEPNLVRRERPCVWDPGRYTRIGVALQVAGEQLCESMDLRAGQSVLDVASGNGNTPLAAARRFCRVVSINRDQSTLEKARRRAEAEDLPIDYRLADIDELPFPAGQFDNVTSTFGVMFGTNHKQSASELLRVCKPGGKIGLTSWMPEGFFGELIHTLQSHQPSLADKDSPTTWGRQAFIQSVFEHKARSVTTTMRSFTFRFQSPAHWADVFMSDYQTALTATISSAPDTYRAIRRNILAIVERFNCATDGTMVVPSRYLDTVIVCDD